MNLESITKQNAKTKAELNVRKYFEEAIDSSKIKTFWAVASKEFPDKVNEINRLKKEIESGEQEVQNHCLSCSLFETLSKELIRLVGVRLIGRSTDGH